MRSQLCHMDSTSNKEIAEGASFTSDIQDSNTYFRYSYEENFSINGDFRWDIRTGRRKPRARKIPAWSFLLRSKISYMDISF